jgi:hypothetical protein
VIKTTHFWGIFEGKYKLPISKNSMKCFFRSTWVFIYLIQSTPFCNVFFYWNMTTEKKSHVYFYLWELNDFWKHLGFGLPAKTYLDSFKFFIENRLGRWNYCVSPHQKKLKLKGISLNEDNCFTMSIPVIYFPTNLTLFQTKN